MVTMIKDECEFSRGDLVFRFPARCRRVALCENEREREIFPQPAQAQRKKRTRETLRGLCEQRGCGVLRCVSKARNL